MRRCLPLVLLSALPILSMIRADESIPAKKLDELKAATVYVKVEGDKWAATGSGFLIQVDGETGLIATNHHVVATPPKCPAGKVSLVFWSGTKKEKVLPPNEATSPFHDFIIHVQETKTSAIRLIPERKRDGRLVIKAVWEERNFDPRNWPTSIDELKSGNAFRGAGISLRVKLFELVID